MQSFARILFGSCVCLVLGCGESASRGPQLGNAAGESGSGGLLGSSSAGFGSAGNAASNVGGTGGASLTQGSAGTAAGGPSEGGNAGSGNPDSLSEVQSILEAYHSFAPQTPEPVSVSGYLFGLCRAPTLRETEFLESLHGDGRYLQDWANPLAVQGLASEQPMTFPVGSVIVKEKYAGPKNLNPDLVAIGLMIKRGSGFDPAHGDWDYAYYEPALGIVQTEEQTAYCATCHAGAAATDYVYVDGLKP